MTKNIETFNFLLVFFLILTRVQLYPFDAHNDNVQRFLIKNQYRSENKWILPKIVSSTFEKELSQLEFDK